MIGDLTKAVATTTVYRTAEKSLVTCLNGADTSTTTPRYTTFDGVLSGYTGATKTRMESGGACASQATAMFGVVQSQSRSRLAALKGDNSEYAALLDTPYGKDFESSVGASYIIKQYAFLLASGTTEEPGKLRDPLYTQPAGDFISGGSEVVPPPAVIPKLGPGLACLPEGVDGARLSLRNKLVVLNCLVFSTPHSFWVNSADELRGSARYAWLGFGDWECTLWADGPLPSCYKHDVALGSLQKFAGETAGAADGDELDEAWNPRNKHLADAQAQADIAKYDCQTPTIAGHYVCSILPSGSGFMTLSGVMHLAINKWNDKDWIYTEHDVKHTEAFPRFVRCDVPKVNHNIAVRDPEANNDGFTFTATWSRWQLQKGCVEDITITEYQLCWYWLYTSLEIESVCSRLASRQSSEQLTIPLLRSEDVQAVELVIHLIPDPGDKAYGDGDYYSQFVYRWLKR